MEIILNSKLAKHQLRPSTIEKIVNVGESKISNCGSGHPDIIQGWILHCLKIININQYPNIHQLFHQLNIKIKQFQMMK